MCIVIKWTRTSAEWKTPPRILANSHVTSSTSANALTFVFGASRAFVIVALSAAEPWPSVESMTRHERTVAESPIMLPERRLRSTRARGPTVLFSTTECQRTAPDSMTVPGPMRQPGPIVASAAILAPGAISASATRCRARRTAPPRARGASACPQAKMASSSTCFSSASGARARTRSIPGCVQRPDSLRQPTASPSANSHIPLSRCADSDACVAAVQSGQPRRCLSGGTERSTLCRAAIAFVTSMAVRNASIDDRVGYAFPIGLEGLAQPSNHGHHGAGGVSENPSALPLLGTEAKRELARHHKPLR